MGEVCKLGSFSFPCVLNVMQGSIHFRPSLINLVEIIFKPNSGVHTLSSPPCIHGDWENWAGVSGGRVEGG